MHQTSFCDQGALWQTATAVGVRPGHGTECPHRAGVLLPSHNSHLRLVLVAVAI